MRRVLIAFCCCGFALLAPRVVGAQEVSLAVGRFLGDDLVDGGEIGGLLPSSLDDAGLYGARLGFGFVFVDLEVSGLFGKTSILDDTELETQVGFRYLEGSVLLKLFPGPVAPFVAAGAGWHRLSLQVDGVPDYSTFGYSAGAGVKVMLGSVGLRGDIRDHITPVSLDELDPELLEALGISDDQTLHNFEISFGLVLAF